MPHTILEETCIGCSACERVCPTSAISGEPKDPYYIDHSICIDCSACTFVCPVECIENQDSLLAPKYKKSERPKAVVSPDDCIGCVMCVDACPFDAITMVGATADTESLIDAIALVDPKKCTGCTVCVDSCGWDSIDMNPPLKLDSSFSQLIPDHVPTLPPSPDEQAA